MLNMTHYKARLDELEATDRRSLIFGIIGSVGLAVLLTWFLFFWSISGRTREVKGTIVSFETTATETGVSRLIYVRLDDGHTVSAGIDGHITPRIGRRALLRATKMPFIGIERFRFQNFLEE